MPAQAIFFLHLINCKLVSAQEPIFVAKQFVIAIIALHVAKSFLFLYNFRCLLLKEVHKTISMLSLKYFVFIEVMISFQEVVLVLMSKLVEGHPVLAIVLNSSWYLDSEPEELQVIGNLSRHIPVGVSVEVSLPLVIDVVLLDGVHQANIAYLNQIFDFTLPGVFKSVLLHLIVILLCYLSHSACAILDYLV